MYLVCLDVYEDGVVLNLLKPLFTPTTPTLVNCLFQNTISLHFVKMCVVVAS